MYNTTVCEIETSTISRDEALTIVQSATDKALQRIEELSPAARISPRRICETFRKDIYTDVAITIVNIDDVTYEDLMNGSLANLRSYVHAATNLINTMRDKTVGRRNLSKPAYNAGFELIDRMGISKYPYYHSADVCFNNATMKPFFVAGCMSYIKKTVADHRAGKIEKNLTRSVNPDRPYKSDRLTVRPNPMGTMMAPEPAPSGKPERIPARPVSCPAKPSATTASAPTV